MTSKEKRDIRELEYFNEIKILLPDDSILKIDIKDHIWINKDVPADVLGKMAKAGAQYARWGVVRADLQAYLETLEESFDLFMKEIMSKARKDLGKATEGAISEKAVLSNQAEYLKKKKGIRRTVRAIEKVKRVMMAIEIMSDMAQSINSMYRKELDLSRDGVIAKGGSLKNKKKGER